MKWPILTVASLVLQAISTFLYTLSAYFFAKWITDRASEELFKTLGEAEVERPIQESLEREYKRQGYLNDAEDDIDYSRIMPEEHEEPDRMAELARDLAPSYADWKMRDMFLGISKKRNAEGRRSKWFGIGVVIMATLLLALSLALT